MTPIANVRQAAILVNLVASLLLLSGCAAPQPASQPTRAVASATEFEEIWDRSLVALRRLGFQPDRQDRANRVIETLPLVSAQWFEPWRRDVADHYSMAESSLDTIHRKVTVRFATAAAGSWEFDVEVRVARLNQSPPQMTSASSAVAMFTANAANEEGEVNVRGKGGEPSWKDLGRDTALESRIAGEIGGTLASTQP